MKVFGARTTFTPCFDATGSLPDGWKGWNLSLGGCHVEYFICPEFLSLISLWKEKRERERGLRVTLPFVPGGGAAQRADLMLGQHQKEEGDPSEKKQLLRLALGPPPSSPLCQREKERKKEISLSLCPVFQYFLASPPSLMTGPGALYDVDDQTQLERHWNRPRSN